MRMARQVSSHCPLLDSSISGKMSPDVSLSYFAILAPETRTWVGSQQPSGEVTGMLLETVFLDERRVELQSGFLGGVLPGEERDKGLALIALELDHLFAIVFDDVAVASCFGKESVMCRKRHASHLQIEG